MSHADFSTLPYFPESELVTFLAKTGVMSFLTFCCGSLVKSR